MGDLSLWGALLGEHCSAHGENIWGWLLYPMLMLYMFYILAQICDGHLTRALEYIVERTRMPEDVAGATFLAMASSAPELFCSMVSTFVLVSASGVGNIVGSAVFNLLVIIGVTPIFSGSSLNIWWYPTARDACFYAVAIVEIFIVMQDGKVYWYEGLIMVLSYITYVFYFTQNQRICDYFGLEASQPGGKDEEDVEKCQASHSSTMAGTGETDEVENIVAIPPKTKVVPCRLNPDVDDFVGREASGSSSKPTSKQDGTLRMDTNSCTSERNRSLDGCCAGKDVSEKSMNQQVSRSGTDVVEFNGARLQSPNAYTLRGKSRTLSLGRATSKGSSSQVESRQQSKSSASNWSQVVPLPADIGVPKPPVGDEEKTAGPHGLPTTDLTSVEEKVEEPEEGGRGWCRWEPMMPMVDWTMPSGSEWLYTLFALCCAWIGIFTYFAVDAAGRLGCVANIPDVVMGLVVLAAGTSVPDAMGSIVVARDGMGDMAVANAVGSNTFDILLGLGLPWFLKGAITQKPVEVPTKSLQEAVVILACCLCFYLVAITTNGWKLTKRLGFCLLGLYIFVIAWILVRSFVDFS
mmetsp:Transcript_15269/g.41832  ORF Transcript_15269/g.41832 Transcript_15269/m.41832 type:complete len:578 (-) Transcript_15269:208-1941(-)